MREIVKMTLRLILSMFYALKWSSLHCTQKFQTVEKVAKCFYEKVIGRKVLLKAIQTDKKLNISLAYLPLFSNYVIWKLSRRFKNQQKNLRFSKFIFIFCRNLKDNITAFCHLYCIAKHPQDDCIKVSENEDFHLSTGLYRQSVIALFFGAFCSF